MPRKGSDHIDHTQDRAVGTIDREWKFMAKVALQIRSSNSNPVWAESWENKFTGIYKRLLTDPISLVEREARR